MIAAATKTQHTVTRLDIPTEMPFGTFCDALETFAPLFDSAAIEKITTRGGSWEDVSAAVAANAPHGLMVFASIDATPLMAAAGHRVHATEYLVGNHVIAETMFRYNPLALLYAPLRMLVYSDAHGKALLSLDQPSSLFASLGEPRITDVGRDLDRKVADFLTLIGIDATAALGSGN